MLKTFVVESFERRTAFGGIKMDEMHIIDLCLELADSHRTRPEDAAQPWAARSFRSSPMGNTHLLLLERLGFIREPDLGVRRPSGRRGRQTGNVNS